MRPVFRGAPGLALCLMLSLALPTAGPVAGRPASSRCEAPADLIRMAPLHRTKARLAAGEPLTVVALGSSSTQGTGASSPAASYPARLEQRVRQRFPGQSIRVLNRGISGENATLMLARLDRDVLSAHPDLVIWQVGSNTVLRQEDQDPVDRAVRQGVDRLQEAGVDVMIMDPQYAPRLLARPAHKAMLWRLDAIARDEGVAMFHRFAVMHHWIVNGQFTFSAMLSPDQLHLNDASYDCLALLLTQVIAESLNRSEPAGPASHTADRPAD